MGEENGKMELLKKKKSREYLLPLKELQVKLNLPVLPKRIEGFDIAHIGGKTYCCFNGKFFQQLSG